MRDLRTTTTRNSMASKKVLWIVAAALLVLSAVGGNETTTTSFPTPTSSATSSKTASNTATRSPTPSETATNTMTGTPSVTASETATSTVTRTRSSSVSGTASRTASFTSSETATSSNTGTPSSTPSVTASRTPSETATNSASVTPSMTGTRTPTSSSSPTYTPTVTPTGSADCPCPAGSRCEFGVRIPCDDGEYSGVGDNECHICPAGHSCISGMDHPERCPNGTYSLGNQGFCIACPSGFACPLPDEAPVPCKAGTFSKMGSKGCEPCPSGSYSPGNGSDRCFPCPQDHACLDPAENPQPCVEGAFSFEGSSFCQRCPPQGFLGNDSSKPSTCSPCPAAHSCESFGDPIRCPEGWVSHLGEAYCSRCSNGTVPDSSQTQCLNCPPGHQCAYPELGAQPCEKGFFASGYDKRTQCVPCPRGTFCAETRTSAPSHCPNGTTSKESATKCEKCPRGFECRSPDRQAVPCAMGEFALVLANGVSECVQCPAGFACPRVDEQPIPCDEGSFSLGNQSSCTVCLSGSKCPSRSEPPIECPIGHYSFNRSTQCQQCPVGSECPIPSATPRKCALGYYADAPGRIQCQQCPAGYYCSDPRKSPEPCLSGSFSTEGSKKCIDCPPGYECPQSTLEEPIPCLPGTHSAGHQAHCSECPAGSECPFTTVDLVRPCKKGYVSRKNSTHCVECPGGYECPSQDMDEMSPCDTGTFSEPGRMECILCPDGFSCPARNSASIRMCRAGTYSDEATCIGCAPGFACSDPANLGEECDAIGEISGENATVCSTCPRGYDCTGSNRKEDMIRCLPGEYSVEPNEGCEPCPAGKKCPSVEESPQQCPPGTWSSGLSTNCSECSAGYYCPWPSANTEIMCPRGTWSGPGMAACRLCSPGNLCPPGSTDPSVGAREDACNVTVPAGMFYSLTGRSDVNDITEDQTSEQCPRGMFGEVQCGSSITDACRTCPPGEYCIEPGATIVDNITRGICWKGFFCPLGTTEPIECPAGTYQPFFGKSSLRDCLLCPEGYSCPSGATIEPFECRRGFYCPPTTVNSTQFPCPAGSWSNVTRLTRKDECAICFPGSYCPTGSEFPNACPEGTYNPHEGGMSISSCLTCDARKSCSVTGLPAPNGGCFPGHYCPPGATTGQEYPCPRGTFTFNDSLALAEECTICPAGSACPQGTGGSQPIEPCEQGHYCPPGTGSQADNACKPGTWSPLSNLTSQSECFVCDEGHYCAGGEAQISGKCGRGHYCPAGTGWPTDYPCPAGTFNPHNNGTKKSDCIACPPGSYCLEGSSKPSPCQKGTYANTTNFESPNRNNSGFPECRVCPGGYFCREGMIEPQPCGKGFFSDDGKFSCRKCLKGFYCDEPVVSYNTLRSEKRCPPGLFCDAGMDSKPTNADKCPKGHYCAEAGGSYPQQPYPRPCPPGSYASSEGQSSCDVCPAGEYCTEGSIEPNGLCEPGYICPNASSSSRQVPCNASTYLPTFGGKSLEQCSDCPSGFYCPRGSANPSDCGPGRYCPTNSVSPELCPKGSFGNGTNLKTESDCMPCTPGFYCDETGLTVPRGPCDPGFFCTIGSPEKQPGRLLGLSKVEYGGLCPPGGYCPRGSFEQQPCPPGTYLNRTGQISIDSCSSCTPGFYCAEDTLPGPTGECFPGYFCNGSAVTPTQFETPPGTFTRSGSSGPIDCPLGTHSTEPKKSECDPCPAGYYCSELKMISPFICPRGSYCPKGSTFPSVCPSGTINRHEFGMNKSSCAHCPGGTYCADSGLEEPSGDCQAGHWCGPGTTVPDPLGEANGDRCPVGTYCEAGASAPAKCPAGTYNSDSGSESLEDCLMCPPGKFCEAGSSDSGKYCLEGYWCSQGSPTGTPVNSSFGGICQPGFECPKGSSEPKQCSPGTFSKTSGAPSCDNCPPGYMCPLYGQIYPEICPRGSFCPLGTADDHHLCPFSTYQPSEGAKSDSDCLDCPKGKYCSGAGLEAPSGDCKRGYYCPSNSEVPTERICPAGSYCPQAIGSPLPCPLGTFNPLEGLASRNACQLCPPGRFCNITGSTTPAGLTFEGFFARLGATTREPFYELQLTELYSDILFNDMILGGDICPNGHFCPEGTGPEPLSCDGGTWQPDIGMSDCLACPAGYFCANGTAQLGMSNVCPEGYFCPEGTTHPFENPCPRGTYRNVTFGTSVSDCLSCTPGSYCEHAGMSYISGKCEAGYFCSERSITSTPNNATRFGGDVCVAGDYCPRGSPEAFACPGGRFCTSGRNITGVCNAGYYCRGGSYTPTPLGEINNRHNIRIGDICPTGAFCPSGSVTATLCPPGSFNNATGVSEGCLTCLPGFECSAAGISYPDTLCRSRFYCPAGTATPNVSTLCPKGHYCPEGSSEPLSCPRGSFQDSTGMNQCKSCPEGYSCPKKATIEPHPCVTGYYCPVNTSATKEFPCSRGTFNNETGAMSSADCTDCPPGFYCGENGLAEPSGLCNEGFYCLRGSDVATPVFDCHQNTYQCQCSFYRNWPFSLASTFSGADSANGSIPQVGDICPKGHYCTEGASAPIPCPVGTYGPSRGGTNASSCAPCKPGYYCPDLGMKDSTAYPCREGFYCPGGDHIPTRSCPPGAFCPQGTAFPRLCPQGSYTNTSGNANCTTCPSRYFCPLSGTEDPSPCPPGFYCPKGSVSGMDDPCPEGTYNPYERLAEDTECRKCDAGMFCGDRGLSVPTGQCSAGFWCIGGALSPAPEDGQTGKRCPEGKFCPTGTKHPVGCPPGTFSSSQGNQEAEDCSPCSGGYLCNSTGLVKPLVACPAGYFCSGANDFATPDILCPKGNKCPGGNDTPLPCKDGTFQDEEGEVECKTCPPGRHCPNAGSIDDPPLCPEGHYCESGGVTGFELPCPKGTASKIQGLTQPSKCPACPPGHYCGSTRLTEPSGRCGPGYYCISGATSPTPSNPDEGGICDAGFVCQYGSDVPKPNNTMGVGYPCPPGHFCPAGTPHEVECEPGTYTPLSGQEECMKCPEGRTCPGASAFPDKCPLFRFCPPGSETGTVCDDGTYNPNWTNLTDSSQCKDCPGGKYCRNGDVTGPCQPGFFCPGGQGRPDPPEFVCPLGRYCPEGSSLPSVCPNGTVRVEEGGASPDDCTSCPRGFICDAVSTEGRPCPPGYYCPERQEQIACPIGTFTELEASWLLSNCSDCASGSLCDVKGIGNLTNHLCPLGHYCPKGTDGSTQNPIECPEGTFRDVKGAASVDECYPCLSGNNCPEPGTIWPIPCRESYSCPEGSVNETACNPGYYCPAKTGTPLLCPGGRFCPAKTGVAPKHCPEQRYCPPGSEFPLHCPAGTIIRHDVSNTSRVTLEDACSVCPPGTFTGSASSLECITCRQGYACLGRTNSEFPQNISSNNGFPCGKGRECPEGSSQERDCVPGTFNPEKAGMCRPCSEGSFQDQPGRSECFPCSSSATSSRGATTCECIGDNRVFQPSDGKCICGPQFEFVDESFNRMSEEDGIEPCQSMVFDHCFQGQGRDSQDGKCREIDNPRQCAEQCPEGGEFNSRTGICDCPDVPIEFTCDETCLQRQPQMRIDSERKVLTVSFTEDDQRREVEVELEEIAGMFGEMECLPGLRDGVSVEQARLSGEGEGCRLQTVSTTDTFTGTYDVPAAVFHAVMKKLNMSSNARRLQDTPRLSMDSPEVGRPLLCVRLGEGVLFDVEGVKSYPVYLKDSLLNTNPNFDYGSFRRLRQAVQNDTNVSTFVFTFKEPGVYHFANSQKRSQRMVVKVLEGGSDCPSSASIQSSNSDNLQQLGARKSGDIVIELNWPAIIALLLIFFLSILSLIGLILYFQRRAWNQTMREKKPCSYKDENKNIDLVNWHDRASKLQDQHVHDKKDETNDEPTKEKEKDKKGVQREQLDLSRWEAEDLDLRGIVERIEHSKQVIKNMLADEIKGTESFKEKIQREMGNLKELLGTGSYSTSDRTGHVEISDVALLRKLVETLKWLIQDCFESTCEDFMEDARNQIDKIDTILNGCVVHLSGNLRNFFYDIDAHIYSNELSEATEKIVKIYLYTAVLERWLRGLRGVFQGDNASNLTNLHITLMQSELLLEASLREFRENYVPEEGLRFCKEAISLLRSLFESQTVDRLVVQLSGYVGSTNLNNDNEIVINLERLLEKAKLASVSPSYSPTPYADTFEPSTEEQDVDGKHPDREYQEKDLDGRVDSSEHFDRKYTEDTEWQDEQSESYHKAKEVVDQIRQAARNHVENDNQSTTTADETEDHLLDDEDDENVLTEDDRIMYKQELSAEKNESENIRNKHLQQMERQILQTLSAYGSKTSETESNQQDKQKQITDELYALNERHAKEKEKTMKEMAEEEKQLEGEFFSSGGKEEDDVQGRHERSAYDDVYGELRQFESQLDAEISRLREKFANEANDLAQKEANEKRRQFEEMQKRLRERRRKREQELRRKQAEEMDNATDPDTRSQLLRKHERQYNDLVKECQQEEQEAMESVGEDETKDYEKEISQLEQRYKAELEQSRRKLEDEKRRQAAKLREKLLKRKAKNNCESPDGNAESSQVDDKSLMEEFDTLSEAAMNGFIDVEAKAEDVWKSFHSTQREKREKLERERSRQRKELSERLRQRKQKRMEGAMKKRNTQLLKARSPEDIKEIQEEFEQEEQEAESELLEQEKSQSEEIDHRVDKQANFEGSSVEIDAAIEELRARLYEDQIAVTNKQETEKQRQYRKLQQKLHNRKANRLRKLAQKQQAEQQKLLAEAGAAPDEGKGAKFSEELNSKLDRLREKRPSTASFSSLSEDEREQLQQVEANKKAISEEYENKLKSLRQQEEKEKEQTLKKEEEEEAKRKEKDEEEIKQKVEAARYKKLAELENKRKEEKLTKEQAEQLKQQYEDEVQDYEKSVRSERERQQAKLKAKLEARRKKRQQEIHRQYKEEAQRLSEQREKELSTLSREKQRQAEWSAIKKAIEERAKEQGGENSDYGAAIQEALQKRHNQELQDLLSRQYSELSKSIDAALDDLHKEKHEEYKELLKTLREAGSTEEEINSAVGELRKRYDQRREAISQQVAESMQSRHSSEQAELRREQLQEISEVLSEFAPEDLMRQRAIEKSRKEAEEVEKSEKAIMQQKEEEFRKMKVEMEELREKQRKEQEEELQRLEERMQEEVENERKRQEKRRKEIEERTEQQKREALKQAESLNEDEKERVMQQFEEEKKQRIEKLDTERDRQQKRMEERLKKRAAKKRLKKQKEYAEQTMHTHEGAIKKSSFKDMPTEGEQLVGDQNADPVSGKSETLSQKRPTSAKMTELNTDQAHQQQVRASARTISTGRMGGKFGKQSKEYAGDVAVDRYTREIQDRLSKIEKAMESLKQYISSSQHEQTYDVATSLRPVENLDDKNLAEALIFVEHVWNRIADPDLSSSVRIKAASEIPLASSTTVDQALYFDVESSTLYITTSALKETASLLPSLLKVVAKMKISRYDFSRTDSTMEQNLRNYLEKQFINLLQTAQDTRTDSSPPSSRSHTSVNYDTLASKLRKYQRALEE